MKSWFSTYWFTLDTLQDFLWQQPNYLLLISAIPFLFVLRWLLHTRFQQKLQVAIPTKWMLWSPVTLLRFIPDILISVSIALMLFSLARPQLVQQRVVQFSEGIDIMLILDVSESMLVKDLQPNRLDAAKKVAHQFIEGRFQDRIGIVVFAGDAYSLVPLTTDYNMLHSYIDEVNSKMIAEGGTAIGSALAVTINRMRESSSKSKVGILLSDGDNTAGNLDPITAAQLAKVYGIKLYTIAVGQGSSLPSVTNYTDTTSLGNNEVDERTLREIARIGEGRFFRATDSQALGEVFSTIDKFEKAEIKETRFKDVQDFYQVYLRWAVVFLLLWLLSKSTFVSNVLED